MLYVNYISIKKKKKIDFILRLLKEFSGELPGGPVVRTLHFHLGGRGFDPWSRS